MKDSCSNEDGTGGSRNARPAMWRQKRLETRVAGGFFWEVCAAHLFLYAQMYVPGMIRRLEMTREIVVFGCGGGMVLRLTGVGGSLRIQVAL